MKNISKTILIFIMTCFSAEMLQAQAGYSSASLSMNRSIGILNSDEVIVEEYMNYHKHNILLPVKGESVALDLRTSDCMFQKNSREMLVQIGIATGFITNTDNIPPLNLTFVIDKSGSMGSNDKLNKVKAALKELIKKLRKKDVLSVVVFDNKASVLLSSHSFNSHKTDSSIDLLQAGGSTNMHDGLISGYQQALKNFNDKKSNCVILLTDGMTNVGITDPLIIISDSKEYNEKGIELTTIGVGNDLNFDLLHKLATQGRGSMHFIENCDDIQKVFIDEVESLLKPVARNIKLQIELPDNLKLETFYGYLPLIERNKISIDLNNFSSGLTQIFMLKFKQKESDNEEGRLLKVNLTFFDFNHKKEIAIAKQIMIGENNINKKEDTEIRKNYSITLLAHSMKEMAIAFEKRNSSNAITIINNSISEVKKMYPTIDDKDILRVLNIAEGYSKALSKI